MLDYPRYNALVQMTTELLHVSHHMMSHPCVRAAHLSGSCVYESCAQDTEQKHGKHFKLFNREN